MREDRILGFAADGGNTEKQVVRPVCCHCGKQIGPGLWIKLKI